MVIIYNLLEEWKPAGSLDTLSDYPNRSCSIPVLLFLKSQQSKNMNRFLDLEWCWHSGTKLDADFTNIILDLFILFPYEN